ncbi:CMRF35-like molecule 7 [Xyrauchen texanus]|uniref:CMRF35-like molecule 7 n=1 Tax=Xyrauchen texanus TaxID=154827 RepID=UPI002242310C|nr:CMRF35-like molecule 7 [Xyrauchen texanus]
MNTILTLTLLMIPGAVMSIRVTGYSGGGVNITCRYNEEKTQNKKYFCRGQWSECKDLIKTNNKDEWTHEGRFSLYDNTTAAVFTVIIRDLNKQDSDTYYCGIDISLSEDLHTEVNLNVSEEKNVHTTSSSPVSWSLPSEITPTSASSIGSSLIIILSVVLVLIIIGLLLLSVTLYKRHQTRGADSSSKVSHVRPGQNEAVCQTVCDYEEIKDIRSSDSNTAQILTNPSDYANALYSTVEHPSRDSPCCITSTDDQNYAAVNFHNISECVDHMSFSNNQDYSEYATVNQATV